MVGLKFLYIKLGWILKNKNPTTFFTHPCPLSRGELEKSPPRRGLRRELSRTIEGWVPSRDGMRRGPPKRGF